MNIFKQINNNLIKQIWTLKILNNNMKLINQLMKLFDLIKLKMKSYLIMRMKIIKQNIANIQFLIY